MTPDIADALEAEGIVEPFPIQEHAVPIGLGGHDIIGQARTGTGKTLAFGIPLLQRIEHGGRRPRALVIVPTRELAIQVTEDLVVAGGKLGSRVLSVYGGRAYEPQISRLREGVEAVVGTPGRLLDLLKQRHLDLSEVSVLVLDEADRMLDLGFLPDVERLMDKVPARRQTMLFSATMSGEIVALARKYLTRPTNVRADSQAEPDAPPQVVQHVFQAHQMDKPELLARVLQARGRGLTMVFCQTKRSCDRVAEDLVRRGFAAAAVHGDLGQGQRERALRAFRSGKIDVLVATDVAARGLDVDDVTHVINHECPDGGDTYLHRIGRTGRAGKAGIAVTLVDWEDLSRWKLVNSALGLEFADPPETYSTSEHLHRALDIPDDATGTLPRSQRDRAGLEAEEVEDIGETGRVRSQREAPRRRRPSRVRRRTRSGRLVDAEGGATKPQATASGADRATKRRRAPATASATDKAADRPRAAATTDETAGRPRTAATTSEPTGRPHTASTTDKAADRPRAAATTDKAAERTDKAAGASRTASAADRASTARRAPAGADEAAEAERAPAADGGKSRREAAPEPRRAPVTASAAGVPMVTFVPPEVSAEG